ncbi:helix-turn-helix transcriptional regulator [Halogeometricum limi]|uniref:Predicted transcriptional regulator, contains HTH domain n=1 Tax=Halogeometricum limi TaxID=555875 RepID=A0A1I6IJ68_9EURY|nr:helix-turn-helix domain-containing protein [Halogeometricum limi]SFR66721.1 Predicted transcriptional regulator, contains HTH domain [Halogeometricum limi]
MAAETNSEQADDVVARRVDVVEKLTAGPRRSADLVGSLGLSRSTVYNALHELESHQLVRSIDGGYELTLAGRLLYDEHRRHRQAVEDIYVPRKLLAHLPVDTDITLGVLEGAETVFAERYAPIRPVAVVERIVREATALKGLGPVVLPDYVDLFYEQFVNDELEAELIFEVPSWEYLVADYPEAITNALDSGNLTVWVTPETLPMGLLLVEEPHALVGIVVYDDDGNPRGILTTETERAYEWGHQMWKQFRPRTTREITSGADLLPDDSAASAGT